MDRNELKQVTLSTIVTAIDGDAIYNGCGLGLKQCNALKPCPVHDQFVTIRNELKSMLERTNIDSLTEAVLDGLTFLKR